MVLPHTVKQQHTGNAAVDISEAGHTMGYVKLPSSLQDEELLSGLCVSAWDMQFYGL